MDHKVGNKTIKVELDALDVATIRAKTPVVTGQLRDGFDITTNGDIENDVEYADEVEFGTNNKPGHFMVERSLSEIGDRLVKRIAEQIDQNDLIKLPDIIIKIGGSGQ